jgi:hypothetical protein
MRGAPASRPISSGILQMPTSVDTAAYPCAAFIGHSTPILPAQFRTTSAGVGLLTAWQACGIPGKRTAPSSTSAFPGASTSTSHFSRLFKEQFGTTPREYRTVSGILRSLDRSPHSRPPRFSGRIEPATTSEARENAILSLSGKTLGENYARYEQINALPPAGFGRRAPSDVSVCAVLQRRVRLSICTSLVETGQRVGC